MASIAASEKRTGDFEARKYGLFEDNVTTLRVIPIGDEALVQGGVW